MHEKFNFIINPIKRPASSKKMNVKVSQRLIPGQHVLKVKPHEIPSTERYKP